MQKEIMHILCCPQCQKRLNLNITQEQNGEIIDGTLTCSHCRMKYEIVEGVPKMFQDLGAHKSISESFGYLWTQKIEKNLEDGTLYGESEKEEVENFFQYMDLKPVDLQNKIILDAGCGCGRLTRALGQYKAMVLGIDISSSIKNVYTYCQSNKNVHILQADVLQLPFIQKCFDYIWSDEAICYSQYTRQAFDNLCRVLKPNGKLYVRVYPKDDQSFVVKLRDFLRITPRLPRTLLLYLCFVLAVPVSIMKTLLRRRGPSFKSNVVILFNSLSPRYINRHTREEVRGWFVENGFRNIEIVSVSDKGIPVRGIKGK